MHICTRILHMCILNIWCLPSAYTVKPVFYRETSGFITSAARLINNNKNCYNILSIIKGFNINFK